MFFIRDDESPYPRPGHTDKKKLFRYNFNSEIVPEKEPHMNANNLLDDILGMIRSVKDDHAKLEKLHKFIREEIYEEPLSSGDALQAALEEDPEIPDRYKPLLNDVGQYLGMGMVCYINPDAL